MEYFSIFLFAVLAIGMGAWGYLSERREWNGGICRATGEPWVRFDCDSQGGRGYRSGDHFTWISWPGIDTPTRKR